MRDEVDIAVRVMSEPPQNLVARDMGPVRYVAVLRRILRSRGMPVRLDDLRTAPLITAAVVGRQLRVAAYLRDERHEVLLSRRLFPRTFCSCARRCWPAGCRSGADYVVQDDLRRGGCSDGAR
jgi:LysR substrate binding domain.